MSSFICGAKHYNSIESALKEYIVNHSYNSDLTPLQITQFVDRLRELNVLCVSFHYKHHYEGTLNAEIKDQLEAVRQKTTIKHLTLLGLYNALRCSNYQIEPEHVEGLFDDMVNSTIPLLDKFMADIAKTICGSLPDDKTNTWEVN